MNQIKFTAQSPAVDVLAAVVTVAENAHIATHCNSVWNLSDGWHRHREGKK